MSLWFNVLSYVALFMAAWTVAANAAYYTGQSLLAAIIGSVVLTALLVLGLRWIGDRKLPDSDHDRLGTLRRALSSISWLRSPWPVIALVSLTVIVLLATASQSQKYYLFYWLGTLICFVAVLARELASPPVVEAEETPPGSAGWKTHLPVVILGLAGAAFSLLVVRPNADDSTYLNRAAAVADMALQPLPHYWTMFPGTSTPFPYPQFPNAAYHDLIGAISWISGLQPTAVSAFIIAPLMAFLLVAAYGLLMHHLAPKAWPWMLIALMAFFMFDGTGRFVTSFGFLRIWQGKSILVNVFTPLAYLLGMRFGSKGRWHDLALLSLAQIAMFGTSINALIQVPVVGATAVLAGALSGSLTFKKLALGVLSSFYTLMFGVLGYVALQRDLTSHVRKPISFDTALTATFGSNEHLALWSALIVLSCLAVPDRRIRLFSVVTGIAALGVFTNPLLTHFIINRISTSSTYWRFFWLLPLPVMGAAVLALPMGDLRLLPKKYPLAQIAVFGLLTSLYVLFAPDRYMLSKQNFATLTWPPAVKVNPESYQIVSQVTSTLDPGTEIIAPPGLSWMFPMMRGYLFPVAPRRNIVRNAIVVHGGNGPDARLRLAVTNYVGAKGSYNADEFIQAFHVWDIRGIVVPHPNELDQHKAFFCLLANAGFKPYDEAKILWIRQGPFPETFVTTCAGTGP